MPNPAQIGKAVQDALSEAKAVPQDMAIMGLPPLKAPGDSGSGGTAPVAGVPIAPGPAGPPGTSPVAGVPIADPNKLTYTNPHTIAGNPLEVAGQANPQIAEGILSGGGNIGPVMVPKGQEIPEKAETAKPSSPAPETPKAAPEKPPAATPQFTEMVRHLLTEPVSYKEQPAAQGSTFNFGDFLKGAGGKLGDFLQRWGMGLQGAPEGKTQGDIQREQAFELDKQKKAAELNQRQQVLDQQFQSQRDAIMQEYNVSNLTQQGIIERNNRLAELSATYANELKMIGPKYEAELRLRSLDPKAAPGTDFVSQ